jgi:hypothetical protein
MSPRRRTDDVPPPNYVRTIVTPRTRPRKACHTRSRNWRRKVNRRGWVSYSCLPENNTTQGKSQGGSVRAELGDARVRRVYHLGSHARYVLSCRGGWLTWHSGTHAPVAPTVLQPGRRIPIRPSDLITVTRTYVGDLLPLLTHDIVSYCHVEERRRRDRHKPHGVGKCAYYSAALTLL